MLRLFTWRDGVGSLLGGAGFSFHGLGGSGGLKLQSGLGDILKSTV